MSAPIDADRLRRWIGREETASDRVTPALVDRFRATLGLSPASLAARSPAPRLIHFCLCAPASPTEALGEDGHPARGGFLPLVPLPRRMWAASDIAFDGDLFIGDEVRRRSTIADVAVKAGRSGALCFVTVDHAIESGGAIRVRDRQTLVYRAADAPVVPNPVPLAPYGEEVAIMEPTPTLLFRYSALTFNGHRIHYDRPYAVEVEGYPGLVVHGPLQASLLFDMAARRAGRSPDRFAFRGVSPLFDIHPMQLHAAPGEDGTMTLWTGRPAGRRGGDAGGSGVAMSGVACVAPLFVPANRSDRFGKAAASAADAIILDLEEAVAPEDKVGARAALTTGFTAKPVIVRINAAGTRWHGDDLRAVAGLACAAVMVPKAERADVLSALALSRPIIALIETAQGIAHARAIAGTPGVGRLAFGSVDYAADLGCAHAREALASARAELVLASRLAGIPPPLDGVTLSRY